MGGVTSLEFNVLRIEAIPEELGRRRKKLEKIERYLSLFQFIFTSLMFGASWCSLYNFETSNILTLVAAFPCMALGLVKLKIIHVHKENEEKAIFRTLECVKKIPGADGNGSVIVLFTEICLRKDFYNWREFYDAKILDRFKRSLYRKLKVFLETVFPVWLVLSSLKDIRGQGGWIDSYMAQMNVHGWAHVNLHFIIAILLEAVEAVLIIISVLVNFYTCLPEDKKCDCLKARLTSKSNVQEKIREVIKNVTGDSGHSEVRSLTLPFRVTVPQENEIRPPDEVPDDERKPDK